jgi:hypothetical protein
MSQYLANELFDAVCNNGSFAVAQVYIKLHLGDPGAAGTSNAAGETDRTAVSFSAAASGVITSDAPTQWVSVSNSEDYSHYSAWDHVSAGNFLWSGLLTAAAVTAGDTFTIAAGDIDLAITLAA